MPPIPRRRAIENEVCLGNERRYFAIRLSEGEYPRSEVCERMILYHGAPLTRFMLPTAMRLPLGVQLMDFLEACGCEMVDAAT